MHFSTNLLFICLIVTSAIIYYFIISNVLFSSEDNFEKISGKSFRSNFSVATPQAEDQGFKYIPQRRLPEIVVAVVTCGDRLNETLVLLKSALIFTEWWQPLRLIVFSEDVLIPKITGKLEEWKSLLNHTLIFEVHPVHFPHNVSAQEWKKLFKPCASQRLFLPSILTHVDALLYVDTDTLFLSPLRKIWHHFSLMNSTQMAALAPEHEDPNTGWYNRFAHHPFYGPLGVNSGVMLMNLTRMREFKWEEYVVPVYKEYKLKINWGDQDIINIIFHFHPDKLYVYPCRYNYRTDHCMYMSVCPSAERDGVAVLHGSRRTFHSDKQPAFRAVYRALEEYKLGSNPYLDLEIPMKSYLEETKDTNCGSVRHIFTTAMEKFLPAPRKET